MKIGIIGDGQLGTYVFENFSKIYKTKMYSLNNGFDIIDLEDLTEIVTNNDIIINCAALTNVDLCEKDQELSKKINFEGPVNLGKLCKEYNKKLIHISTDYVYGSNDIQDNLTEYDYFMNNLLESKPINAYGYHKLLADESIESLKLANYLIIRPSWVFGKTNPQNFIEKIKNNLLSNSEIKVVDDQYGIPTSVEIIFKVMYKFILNEIPSGLYNLRNEKTDNIPSRYDIACFIKLVINSNCKIIPCKTSEFVLPAKRQLNSYLNIEKIKKENVDIPTWKEEIIKYFK